MEFFLSRRFSIAWQTIIFLLYNFQENAPYHNSNNFLFKFMHICEKPSVLKVFSINFHNLALYSKKIISHRILCGGRKIGFHYSTCCSFFIFFLLLFFFCYKIFIINNLFSFITNFFLLNVGNALFRIVRLNLWFICGTVCVSIISGELILEGFVIWGFFSERRKENW